MRQLERVALVRRGVKRRSAMVRGRFRPRRSINLARIRPVSDHYGWDRGTPVDRLYIEEYLEAHAAEIRGRVLEVGSSDYTLRFGGDRVHERQVLDIDPHNQAATIVADLSEPGALPIERFDCFVLVQTLQYVRDVEVAISNAWRALAPGGTLLITAPSIGRIDPQSLGSVDRWRFTPAGLQTVLERTCPPPACIDVVGYGNVMAAASFLYGLVLEELVRDDLAHPDPAHPLVACARVYGPDMSLPRRRHG